jgi:hypothetical protein
MVNLKSAGQDTLAVIDSPTHTVTRLIMLIMDVSSYVSLSVTIGCLNLITSIIVQIEGARAIIPLLNFCFHAIETISGITMML